MARSKDIVVALVFVGPADQYIDGVPQADVEVTPERAQELIATGLYARKNEKAAAAAEEATP